MRILACPLAGMMQSYEKPMPEKRCKDMNKKHYIGIDVSKKTLDVSIFGPGKTIKEFQHGKFDNNGDGWKSIRTWLGSLGINPKDCAFAMEYTGCYSDGLRLYFAKKHLVCHMVNPLEMKLRSGVVKDKNDRDDAARIADYLARHADILEPTPLPSATLRKLDDLRNERKEYVKQRAALRNRKQAIEDLSVSTRHRRLIEMYDDFILKVEQQMENLIAKDKTMAKNYQLLLSIRGIGPVNAINAIVITQNFTAFETARQYASYIGVAPGRKDSGTGVHWKPKPSNFSDLQAKADLTEAARSVILTDSELGGYYQRKTQRHENDPDTKRKVLNAVKFKLILRMFAVIRRQQPYIERSESAATSPT